MFKISLIDFFCVANVIVNFLEKNLKKTFQELLPERFSKLSNLLNPLNISIF